MNNKRLSNVEKAIAPLIEHLVEACVRVEGTGDIRLRKPLVEEVVILAAPKVVEVTNPSDLFGEKMPVNMLSEKLKLLQKSGVLERRDKSEWIFAPAKLPFRLIVVAEAAWVTMLFRTSCRLDLDITVATAVKNLGLKWVPRRGGFEAAVDPRIFMRIEDERDIFKIARLPYVAPENRGGMLYFPKAATEFALPMTLAEVRRFAHKRVWVDTWCGGEYHQYTFRTAGDEMEFLRMAHMTREYGYNGMYYGRKWRYLDLDGYQYFDCGGGLRSTGVINRKELRCKEHPWKKNPVPWVDDPPDPPEVPE